MTANIRQFRVAPFTLASAILVATMAPPAPLAAQQRDHCGPITSNETWTPAGNPHLVRCTVTVRNSRLTLAPGTTVLMDEGTNLVIGAGSSLEAVGNETGTVAIRANHPQDTPGFWGQIHFEAGAEPSRMDSIIVRGGGAEGLPMIEVEDAVVDIFRAQVRQSGGPALSFWANSLGPSLEMAGQVTTDYDCVGKPHPALVLDQDAILAIIGGEHKVTESQSWHHFCAPYHVQGDLVVAGPEEPLLLLDRGVTLAFEPDTALIVGESDESLGALDFNGSLDQPVLLTGQVAEPGGWRGLVMTEYTGFSALLTGIIEYGGQGGQPMVTVMSPYATALDLHFRHGLGYPLGVMADAVGDFLAGVGVEGDEPAFQGNGVQRILVLTDPESEDVTTQAAHWRNVGIPYEVDGTLTVGNSGLPAGLTLSPGVTLLFPAGAALEIAEAGTLVAKGARSRDGDLPVTLAALTSTPGAWPGVRVRDGADLVQMDLVVLANGGAGDEAMLAWGAAAGTITRTTFRGATGYPVSLPLSRAADVIMGEAQIEPGQDMRNRFVDNGLDRVLVNVDGPLTNPRLKDWADPGAPVEFDGSVTAASEAGPRMIWHDGLDLRFRAGAGFQLGGEGLGGVIEVLNEDSGAPVRLGPVDPESGWVGFTVGRGGVVTGAGLHLHGAPAEGANLRVSGGRLSMSELEVVGQGQGTGLEASAEGNVTLTGSRFSGLAVGIRTREGARLDISRSVVQGNTTWGILNEDPNRCQRALLVYWGSSSGPRDTSGVADGCMNAANDSPEGDRVSDHIEWWPYALNDTDFSPAPGIGPNARRLYLPWAGRP